MLHGLTSIITERGEGTVTLKVKFHSVDASGLADPEAAIRQKFPADAHSPVVEFDC